MTTRLQDTKSAANERRFNQLAAVWKAETELYSKVTKRILHPAYQKIIGMGETAIPFILKDLSDNGPDDWFWALTAITDENPITDDMAGDMHAMTEAWLQWGKKAGYLSDSPNPSNGSSSEPHCGPTRAGPLCESQSDRIDAFFSDSQKVLKAMAQAVQDALRVHKALGHSVVSWENGKVVIIPPEEIQLEEPISGPVQLPQDMIP